MSSVFFFMWCPKCLLSSLCGVRNVFCPPWVVCEIMSSVFLMWCPKYLLSSLSGVRNNVFCLPYVVTEMSSVFRMWCPKCLLFSSICCRERKCPSVMHMSLLFLSGDFTVYSLRKICLIRTVVNIACMLVGRLISATCLGRIVETECKQRNSSYNTLHSPTHASTKDPRTYCFLKI
jgi:hypothetical protein